MNARWPGSALRVIIALVGLACDDPGPGVTPRAIEIVSGDGQGASPGEMAPEPLRIRVMGSDQQPLAGASVTWSIASGDATLASTQSRTNAQGEAETRVTLTGTGSVEVRATVGGLSPVTFSISVVDPCSVTSARSISLDVTVTGTLHPLDCDMYEERFTDLYSFRTTTQQLVTLQVRGTTFDPYAKIFSGEPNGYFDRGDVADTVDATRLASGRWILPAGDYVVAPTSWQAAATGAYELLVSSTPTLPTGCAPVWVTPRITTAQVLASTDCTDTTGPFHRDEFFIIIWQGERVTLTHSSTEFSPRLRLLRLGGALVSESDGSATGTALITFRSDATEVYVVHATSAAAGRVGAYTFAVLPGAP